jgi:hypothetical protein
MPGQVIGTVSVQVGNIQGAPLGAPGASGATGPGANQLLNTNDSVVFANLTANNVVTATYFYGDGSHLTGIVTNSNIDGGGAASTYLLSDILDGGGA